MILSNFILENHLEESSVQKKFVYKKSSDLHYFFENGIRINRLKSLYMTKTLKSIPFKRKASI